MKEILEALREYMDKHFDYEYYSRQTDESGYRQSCVGERKAKEQAWAKVEEACNNYTKQRSEAER